MSFLKKFLDPSKEGPGVSKEHKESGIGRFFRILKSKFWKICSLNLIFIACLIPLIVMSVVIFNITPLSDKSVIEEYLYSNNVSPQFSGIVEKYIESYKPNEKVMVQINASLANIIDTVNKVNPELITDGTVGFDNSKFNKETSNKLVLQIEGLLNTIEKDRFKLEFSSTDKKWSVVDTKSNDYILTSVSVKDGTLSINDYIPNNYTEYFYWVLVLLPFALIGPATAGIVKVSRDFVREEPVFLFSDFKDAAKKNFWPSLVISIIQYFAVAIIINAVSLYYSYLNSGWIYLIGFAGSLFLAFLFIAMHFYIMLMQVTLKLSLKNIYKNAFFFSIICLIRNTLLIVGFAVSIFLIWLLFFIGQAYTLILGFLLLLISTFLIAFAFFVVMYAVYPPVKRVIIDPYYEQHKEETAMGIKMASEEKEPTSHANKESENINSNNSDSTDEESDYVYHNGRMIHRSALESETLFKD